MDTRIALSGTNPDMYGALMRGYQGAAYRQQDQQAQEDRTALHGALAQRYANDPTAGVLGQTEQGQRMLGFEQNQARLGVDQQRADLESQKYQSERITERGGMVLKMGEALKPIPEGPEREAAFGEMLRNMSRLDREAAEDLASDFPDLSNDGLSRSLAGYAQYGEKPAEDPSVMRIADSLYPRGTPQWKDFVSKNAGTGTNVNVNVSPEGELLPGKSNATESFTQLVNAGQSLNRLKTIKEAYSPYFMTYRGQISDAALRTKEKLGLPLDEEERDFVQQKQKFHGALKREFNLYKREITGAAAAVQEMEDLKETMMNEDMSSSQFEAAYDAYATERAYVARLQNTILRKGLRPGTQSFGEALDNLYLSGVDDDTKARGDEIRVELRRNGVPEEELNAKVDEILIEEGYQ